MTYREILDSEQQNSSCVILYLQGNFLRAYEHSAFLFHQHIHAFKLSYRYIQTVNRYVVSLGFPAFAMKKWMGRFPMQRKDEKTFVFDVNKKVDEVTYHNWKELVAGTANPGDKYTVQTRLIEKQPVFKVAYDQYIQVMGRSKNFSRHIRVPLGDETKTLLHRLCHEIRQLYDVEDRSGQIDRAQARCDELLLNYQALRDLREITSDCFALLSEGIVSVRTQLEGLRRTAKAKVYAGTD